MRSCLFFAGMQKMFGARKQDSRSSVLSDFGVDQLNPSLAVRSQSLVRSTSSDRQLTSDPEDNDPAKYKRARRMGSLHLGLQKNELPKDPKTVRFRGERIQV